MAPSLIITSGVAIGVALVVPILVGMSHDGEVEYEVVVGHPDLQVALRVRPQHAVVDGLARPLLLAHLGHVGLVVRLEQKISLFFLIGNLWQAWQF